MREGGVSEQFEHTYVCHKGTLDVTLPLRRMLLYVGIEGVVGFLPLIAVC